MGRFWIGLALLLGFAILGIGVSVWVTNTQEPISAQLAEAADYAANDAQEKAVQLAQQAQNRWQQYREGMACVIDHAPMDEIDSLFAQLEAWAARGNTGEFASCCAQLRQLIQVLTEGQQFTWWNLL